MRYYYPESKSIRINLWDVLALFIIFGLIAFLAVEAMGMTTPYEVGQLLKIDLNPWLLPHYAIRSTLRIILAMTISLSFTFTIGTLAAKSNRAERIIIPMIDILQSVPVLSFMSLSMAAFIKLFPNSLMGPECASIFVIFTSQAWNMTLGFYQTVRQSPAQLKEVARLFQLGPWRTFWKIEVPFSMSPLLWNMMVSMSASWFFVVASESINIGDQDIQLPGIGSYIALAIDKENILAVFYAIFSMLVVILIYDQLLFRPLINWAERYNTKEEEDSLYDSWFNRILERTLLVKWLGKLCRNLLAAFIALPIFQHKAVDENELETGGSLIHSYYTGFAIQAAIFLIFGGIFFYMASYLYPHITSQDIYRVLWLGFLTSMRVFILLVLSSLVWVPVGVWIGLRPKLSLWMQPVIQFFAAFPANLFFPLVVVVIAHYQLNVEIWTTPLMILGSQWYILFNVVAGTRAIPKELKHATKTFHIKGWLWWRKFALPAIFPYYVTGAISAAGGAWNASIVSEWVNWGPTTLKATGLGAYIQEYAIAADYPRIVLGTACMCLYVLFYNRYLWQPLYHLAERRYKIE